MASDPVSSITSVLKKERLIPDVLPESFTPTVLFEVLYPNGEEVMVGNTMTPAETAEEPSISLTPLNVPSEAWNTEGGESRETTYTLVMLDPDAPTRAEPIYRSFRHWVVCRRCC